jgi:FkbM family methyltransferase
VSLNRHQTFRFYPRHSAGNRELSNSRDAQELGAVCTARCSKSHPTLEVDWTDGTVECEASLRFKYHRLKAKVAPTSSPPPIPGNYGSNVRKMIKQLVQGTLSKFGFRIVRTANMIQGEPGLGFFLGSIKRLGFSPKHIVDIGANHGSWTRKAIEFFPDADYTLFEPQDHLRVYIEDMVAAGRKIRWVGAGVGDSSGKLPFSISVRDDSSTFLQPRQGAAQQTVVEVKTLDEFFATSQLAIPEMVKIDAEGFDVKILNGATKLLGKTEIILAEAAVCNPEFENKCEVLVKKMADSGYSLIDLTELIRSPKHGLLWLCEMAFLRKDSRLLEKATSYE